MEYGVQEAENGLAVRRLLVAILRRAVLDFVQYQDCERSNANRYQLHVEAAGWLFSDAIEGADGEYNKYTFLQICSLLGMNPMEIREQALTLTKEDLHRFSADTGST
jgi:hypothetical protein